MTRPTRTRFAPRLNHVAISDGSRRCSTTPAAPRSSTSTATCSAGPKATTPASAATRSSSTPATFGQFVYLAAGRAAARPRRRGRPLRSAGRDARASSRRSSSGRSARARPTTVSASSTSTRAPRTARAHDYTLTSAYIGFVLPLTIELQHIAHADVPDRERRRAPIPLHCAIPTAERKFSHNESRRRQSGMP